MNQMHKQVDRSHYQFQNYLSKPRWASIWHQIDEVLRTNSKYVLEIGPGPGIFKACMATFGVKVETVDIDPELSPDHLCPVTKMPFADGAYDAVCAFQMLEHLPHSDSLLAFQEMARVASKHIILSLPDSHQLWRFLVTLPKLGEVQFAIPRPVLWPRMPTFDGQHYWEIGWEGYPIEEVVSDFCEAGAVTLTKCFRVPEFSYHRFLVFEKLVR